MANPSKISEYLKKHRLNLIMRRFLIGAASVVVFITTYMLMLPAITLELQSLKSPEEAVSTNGESGSVSGNDIFGSVSSGDLITGTETPEEWEKLTENVVLTGNWSEDIVAIARTQLGYMESNGNYLIGEDGATMGYTRYGDWYGQPYGDWSAMFVSFCLNYAQIDEEVIPREADSQRWIETLLAETVDRYRPAADYTPIAGDMMFLDLNEDGKADHVGIIEEITEPAEDETTQARVIVGDLDNVVQYNTYSLIDSKIIGYGRMEKPSVITYKKSYADEKVVITAYYTEEAQIPKEAELLAYQVTAETAPERYENRQKEAHAALQALKEAENNETEGNVGAEGIGTEDVGVEVTGTEIEEPKKDYLIYNIGFFLDGQELEPADAVTITVQFLSEEGFAVGDPVTIVHFSEDGTETLDGANVTQDENGALSTSFETANFSDFAFGIDSVADVPVVYAATNEVREVNADNAGSEFSNVFHDWSEFNGTIRLTSDVAVEPAGWSLGGANSRHERNVTIDLNGYNITVTNGQPLVKIFCNATLEITDSRPAKYSQTIINNPDSVNGKTASYENGVWTYYITDTEVTDSGTGATKETLYQCTVQEMVQDGQSYGGVITGGYSAESLFYVHSDNGAAKPAILNINGGIITGCSNRAIYIRGGVLNLNGGYLLGNSVNTNSENGGAISAYSDISAITINMYGEKTAERMMTGTVLAANMAYNGGAINVQKNIYDVALNMYGGVVSGNTATNNGGGIRVQNCTVNMKGGYITNNIALGTEYNDGGGGVLVRGDQNFTMDGGYITGNVAASGGGIYTHTEDPVKLFMSGGYVTANLVRTGEGGGIRIDINGIGKFTGGHITNNTTDTYEHWGGGGVFIADGGVAYLSSVLVTNNTADGFGGGVAGCSTGRIHMSAINYQSEGAAIFDNTAYDAGMPGTDEYNSAKDDADEQNGKLGPNLSGTASAKAEDHIYAYGNSVFMENGYKDFFCVLYSHVQNGMLGGGSEKWFGSIDGNAVVLSELPEQQATANSIIGLNANPSGDNASGDKALAMNAANLFINGNSSNTHGGGILCNGYTVLGAIEDNITGDEEVKDVDIYLGSRLGLVGTKQLVNQDDTTQTLTDGQFSFTVTDALGNEVAKAVNDANGNLVFDRRLVFGSEGTFVYYLTEDDSDSTTSGITTDKTIYTITVTTKQVDDYLGVLEGSEETVFRHIYMIKQIMVEKLNYGAATSVVTTNVSYEDAAASEQENRGLDITLTSGTTFVNYVLATTDVKVQKKWYQDMVPDGIAQVTVRLYKDNVQYGNAVTLNEANNWSYTWSNLPVRTDGNFHIYRVEEDPISLYMAEYEVTSTGQGSSYWVPATELNAGSLYMIVSELEEASYALKVTDAHKGSRLDGEDKLLISDAKVTTSEDEALKIGTQNYTTWYDPDKIRETKAIFTAQSYTRDTGSGFVLKNNGNKNSWLLLQWAYESGEIDDGGVSMKGAEGVGSIQYASFFDIIDGTLQASYGFANPSPTNMSNTNEPYTVLYQLAEDRFNAIKNMYLGNDNNLTNTVKAKVYTLAHAISGGTTTYTITNTPVTEVEFELELTKVGEKPDSQGNEILLAGAEFELKYNNGNYLYFIKTDEGFRRCDEGDEGATKTLITDENGVLKISGVKGGNYTLFETKAPPGYEKLKAPIYVNLLEDLADKKWSFKIADPLIQYELPKTGGSGTISYTLAGLLMLSSATYLLYRRAKRRREGILSP